ncbi:MAG TPA: hypothetical protein VIK92_03240 [Thermaerobacter sp.]|nr:MAG: hypothetical protein DIU69_12535 [Bacillota bacterium]
MANTMSARGRLLSEIYRRGIRLEVAGGAIRMVPPEKSTPELQAMVEADQAWLIRQLTTPYDHEWVLDATAQILSRTAAKLGDRPLPPEAARALDDVDRAAVEGSRLGVLVALAGFEAAVEDAAGS